MKKEYQRTAFASLTVPMSSFLTISNWTVSKKSLKATTKSERPSKGLDQPTWTRLRVWESGSRISWIATSLRNVFASTWKKRTVNLPNSMMQRLCHLTISSKNTMNMVNKSSNQVSAQARSTRLSVYVKPTLAVLVMAHSLRNSLMKWVTGSVKSVMNMGQQPVVLVVLVGLTQLSCAIAVACQELPTLA